MVWGEQSANNVDSSEETNEFGFARVMIIELLVGKDVRRLAGPIPVQAESPGAHSPQLAF